MGRSSKKVSCLWFADVRRRFFLFLFFLATVLHLLVLTNSIGDDTGPGPGPEPEFTECVRGFQDWRDLNFADSQYLSRFWRCENADPTQTIFGSVGHLRQTWIASNIRDHHDLHDKYMNSHYLADAKDVCRSIDSTAANAKPESEIEHNITQQLTGDAIDFSPRLRELCAQSYYSNNAFSHYCESSLSICAIPGIKECQNFAKMMITTTDAYLRLYQKYNLQTCDFIFDSVQNRNLFFEFRKQQQQQQQRHHISSRAQPSPYDYANIDLCLYNKFFVCTDTHDNGQPAAGALSFALRIDADGNFLHELNGGIKAGNTANGQGSNLLGFNVQMSNSRRRLLNTDTETATDTYIGSNHKKREIENEMNANNAITSDMDMDSDDDAELPKLPKLPEHRRRLLPSQSIITSAQAVARTVTAPSCYIMFSKEKYVQYRFYILVVLLLTTEVKLRFVYNFAGASTHSSEATEYWYPALNSADTYHLEFDLDAGKIYIAAEGQMAEFAYPLHELGNAFKLTYLCFGGKQMAMAPAPVRYGTVRPYVYDPTIPLSQIYPLRMLLSDQSITSGNPIFKFKLRLSAAGIANNYALPTNVNPSSSNYNAPVSLSSFRDMSMFYQQPLCSLAMGVTNTLNAGIAGPSASKKFALLELIGNEHGPSVAPYIISTYYGANGIDVTWRAAAITVTHANRHLPIPTLQTRNLDTRSEFYIVVEAASNLVVNTVFSLDLANQTQQDIWVSIWDFCITFDFPFSPCSEFGNAMHAQFEFGYYCDENIEMTVQIL